MTLDKFSFNPWAYHALPYLQGQMEKETREQEELNKTERRRVRVQIMFGLYYKILSAGICLLLAFTHI